MTEAGTGGTPVTLGVDSEAIVTIAEARAHLRLSTDSKDAYVKQLLLGAQGWIERQAGTRFTSESRTEYHAGGYPFLRPYVLPIASVSSIVDLFDDNETLDTADYTVENGEIRFREDGNYPYNWPSGHNRYLVTLVSGYNDLNETAPAGSVAAPSVFEWAVMALTARAYAVRGGDTTIMSSGMTTQYDMLGNGEIMESIRLFILDRGNGVFA